MMQHSAINASTHGAFAAPHGDDQGHAADSVAVVALDEATTRSRRTG
jgi:hypothetical protein